MTETAIPAGSRAVLIGVSAYEYAEFPPIRAARNSTQAVYDLLADPALCGWAAEQITVISNPGSAESLAVQIADLAESTTGVLLLYYVGHGILSDAGELCLTVTSTRPNRPKISGLPWSTIADVLRACPARIRLVILDCCFAGQAIEALSGPGADLADIAHVQGVYTLTATTRNRTAHVPPPDQQDTACTSFTGELRDLIRSGIRGGPPMLTFGDIYPVLRQRLHAKGLPAPSQRGTDTAHHFLFTANAATHGRTSTVAEAARTVPEHQAGPGPDHALEQTGPVADFVQQTPSRRRNLPWTSRESSSTQIRPSRKTAGQHKAQERSFRMSLLGRRNLVAGGGVIVVAAAMLLAVLWPGSPFQVAADPRVGAAATHRASVTATSEESVSDHPTAATTRPRPTPSPTPSPMPHTRATSLVTSPTDRPTVSTVRSRRKKPTTSPSSESTGPPCTSGCVALYNLAGGTSELLAVVGAVQKYGQPVDLQEADSDNIGEDWTAYSAGTVSSLYAAGQVSAGFNQNYGGNNASAIEFEYTPSGAPVGLCLGVSGTAGNGSPVTLQPCDVSAATVWVFDTAAQSGQQAPLINGTDTNFTQPLVLTATGAGAHATTSSLAEASGGMRNAQYWYWGTEPSAGF